MAEPPQLSKFLLGHSLELLEQVLGRVSTPADLTISRFFAARRYLGSHDRGFLSDTLYSVLRSILRLQSFLDSIIEPGPSQAPFILAGYLLEQNPHLSFEILEDGLELTVHQLHAVTKLLGEGRKEMEKAEEPRRSALKHAMPDWLVEKLLNQWGAEFGELLLDSLNHQAPITLRANRLRTTREELLEAFDEYDIPATAGEYSQDAVLLRRRLNAYGIPEFKQGWFELQDEGSQMLSQLLDPHPNWRVFDACAGAGGKTLHLAAIMKGRGEVTAHDVNARRLSEIKPRLKRSTAQNVRVLANEEYEVRREKLLGTQDALMIDAPCSGTGVLRRNPGARLVMHPDDIERLAKLQSEILEEYSPLVKPGGIMLYATCSVLKEEGEERVAEFLEKHGEHWQIESQAIPEEMRTSEGAFRCFPNLHNTDGFFAALMRRKK